MCVCFFWSLFLLLASCECYRILQVIMQPEIRAACIQVLFSAVYHLKSAVLPYSLDLLKLSLKALRKESEKVINSSLARAEQVF